MTAQEGQSAPLVAIVIVNHLGWENCHACLESLAQLDYPRFQVFLVANSAPDEPPKLPQPLNVTLIRNQDNRGFAAACNQALYAAKPLAPKYVWLLNNDAEAAPQALTALVAEAKRDSSVGAVGSVVASASPSSDLQLWGGGRISSISGLPHHVVQPPAEQLHYICGVSMLIPNRAIDGIGPLDERYFMYWEDTDFCFRLARSGWRLAVAQDSHITHSGDFSIGAQSEFFDYHFTRSSVVFFRRHFPLWPIPVFVSVLGRSLRRIAAGRWTNARATLAGFVAGLTTQPSKPERG